MITFVSSKLIKRCKIIFVLICSVIVLFTSSYLLGDSLSFLLNSQITKGTILSVQYSPAMPSRFCFSKVQKSTTLEFLDIYSKKHIITITSYVCNGINLTQEGKLLKIIYDKRNYEKAESLGKFWYGNLGVFVYFTSSIVLLLIIFVRLVKSMIH